MVENSHFRAKNSYLWRFFNKKQRFKWLIEKNFGNFKNEPIIAGRISKVHRE